ncbi:hypothetical protein Tco_0847717 [Tanacetum coccineum]
MANLKFYDTHNMVAYLLKPEGSEDFHQIVDFLNTSHIKYALTENPTIHVSLIQQFWQTAFASTFENGEMEITGTIDGRVKTITEASIRRHLKLEDSDGISTLPNTEIFKQLALMRTYIAPTLTHKLFSNMRRDSKGYTRVDIPLFPAMLVQGPNLQGQGSTVQSDSHHTTTSASSTSQLPTLPPSMQTTHVAEEAATLPHDSPLPRIHSLGSDEGKLDKEVKINKARRRAKIVVSDDDDAKKDTPDSGGSKILADVARVHTYSRRRRTVSTGSGEISTAVESVSTAGALMPVSTAGMDQGSIPSPIASKDKGKAIMRESEPEQATTKLKQRQEIAGYEAAIRLQEQLDEEESQKIARDAEGFIDAEWDDILTRVAADEDLVQQLQAGEKYSEEDLWNGYLTKRRKNQAKSDKTGHGMEKSLHQPLPLTPHGQNAKLAIQGHFRSKG